MDSNCDVKFNQPLVILQSGDSGEAVCELQSLLNHKGSRLSVNGTFNTSTLSAVISFQQRKGLRVSGQVDQETWQALHQ